MATKKKQTNKTNTPWGEGFHKINTFWQSFEGEVDKALKTARKQGKKSALTIRKRVDSLIDQVGANDIGRKAIQKSEELGKEVLNNLSSTLTRLQDSEVVEYARIKANGTRNQVLSALNIPSNDEVAKLTRKLSALEKKLSTIQKHQARR